MRGWAGDALEGGARAWYNAGMRTLPFLTAAYAALSATVKVAGRDAGKTVGLQRILWNESGFAGQTPMVSKRLR